MGKQFQTDRVTANGNKKKRLEILENENRKNNLIVSGILVDNNLSAGELTQEITNKLNGTMRMECSIQEARKIGQNRFLVQIRSFEEKLQILKMRIALKGERI